MNLRKTITLVLLGAIFGAQAFELPDGSAIFSYDHGRGFTENVGNSKRETYDSAIGIHSDDLTGCSVDGVRVPMASLEGISDFSVWLTRELAVASGHNVADIINVSVDNPRLTDDGFIEVNFPTPYIIGPEGVYVGYSFTVTELNDSTKWPIVVTDEVHADAYWAHSSKTTLRWLDRTETLESSLAMQVLVSGMPEAKAELSDLRDVHVQAGNKFSTRFTLANMGWGGIESVEYEYTVGGKTGTATAAVGDGKRIIGCLYKIEVELPAVIEVGESEYSLRIASVNGKPNASEACVKGKVVSHEFLPTHRPVLEEYSGTWCGWCMRGVAAMEGMAELYPKDFIGVVYHNDDPMMIMEIDQFPQYPTNFPWSFIDRGAYVDPFYGDTSESLGIRYAWDDRRNEVAPADIEVTVALSADRKSIEVKATLDFELDHKNADFKMAYLLVHDGMKGDPEKSGYEYWLQGNAYSSKAYTTNERYYSNDPWLGKYVELPLYIPDFEFNDVVVATSSVKGIPGSLPKTIKSREKVTHSYSFPLKDARSIFDGNNLIQDVEKLRVVALLIDKQGRIANANQATVVEESGVAPVTAIHREPALYDMQGRPVPADARGLLIEVGADGSVRKVYRR